MPLSYEDTHAFFFVCLKQKGMNSGGFKPPQSENVKIAITPRDQINWARGVGLLRLDVTSSSIPV